MGKDQNKEAIFTVGDIAKDLGVAGHVVRHYTDNLEDILGDNMQIDKSNGYRKYTSDGLRLLKVVRRLVQDEKKTLEQVREQLLKERKDNLPIPTSLELDMAKSYATIAQDISIVREQTANMIKVIEFLTGRLEGLDNLPNVIKAYHDETKLVIENQQEEISDLHKLLGESTIEKEALINEVQELKSRIGEIQSGLRDELEKTAEHILAEGEKRWAAARLPEKREKKGFFGFFSR